MYCGNTSEGAPVLRFLGSSDGTNAQKPAFAYGIKKDSSSLYKISLTSTSDDNAFGAGNISISKSIVYGIFVPFIFLNILLDFAQLCIQFEGEIKLILLLKLLNFLFQINLFKSKKRNLEYPF